MEGDGERGREGGREGWREIAGNLQSSKPESQRQNQSSCWIVKQSDQQGLGAAPQAHRSSDTLLPHSPLAPRQDLTHTNLIPPFLSAAAASILMQHLKKGWGVSISSLPREEKDKAVTVKSRDTTYTRSGQVPVRTQRSLKQREIPCNHSVPSSMDNSKRAATVNT